jgi:uncharacterized Ntn-hydrolase superfamily protein
MARLLVLLTLVVAMTCAAGAEASGPPTGTFSIVARDPATGELGVAVQSRAFNVGAGVAWARARVGAVATQSSTNESFGPDGLRLLDSGLDARTVLSNLLEADPGREQRQVGIIDAWGKSATFTGEECMDWAGGRTAPNVAVQGNILAGEAVVAEMMRAFVQTKGELSVRLLEALKAGQAAGGDKRGQQSAALLVVRPSDKYPEYEERYVSLRVDDHETPIAELERIYRIHEATDLAEAHLRYAEMYREEGRADDAKRELDLVGEALKRILDDPDAGASSLNGLAWYTCSNDVFLDEALTAVKRALELEPESAETLDTLAECHFRRGEIEEALVVINRALELSPGDPYLESQKKRFEEAAGG